MRSIYELLDFCTRVGPSIVWLEIKVWVVNLWSHVLSKSIKSIGINSYLFFFFIAK